MTPQQANWVAIVRDEYQEMPGLRLTKAQMKRLWGFDAATCELVVELLVRAHFLKKNQNDSYTLGHLDVYPHRSVV